MKKPVVPPGDDVCPTPPPLDEDPPEDRFCDLVLTGGVASGVVYPWAIVELARAYRFRSIGGTSVGAMAAALAAAAEYGRRTGAPAPFEVLRRAPAALGEVLPDGRTRMLSLFQPNEDGKRLMRIWGRLGTGRGSGGLTASRLAGAALSVYKVPAALGVAVALLLALGGGSPLVILLLVVLGVVVGVLAAAWRDIRNGLIGNNLGLCKGGTLEKPGTDGQPRPALSEWLHENIQRSAGLKCTDRPLTFRDLWCAPAHTGGPAQPCTGRDPPAERSINLQVITTNATHGRPYRLPLTEDTSRLFFKRKDLEGYFPECVLDALEAAATPYAPRTSSDPPASDKTKGLLQLPGADLPIVVAARLSLSFPLLFSAVQLWAIDHEPPRGQRDLKPCQFTDGGASSNFPVHLFDMALPRWPTFGLWLDRRNPYRPRQHFWLPEFQREGWGDSWNRFDPEAAGPAGPAYSRKSAKYLIGFLAGISSAAVDWRDRTSFRLPHVRNRVARLLLEPGEGGLHIAMPREQILRMAHRYGTQAGRLFVERFADRDGRPSQAWREQRWVRLELLVNGLRERLTGLARSADWMAHTVPMSEAIQQAVRDGPLQDREDCNRLNQQQANSLERLLGELERLEITLRDAESQRFQPVPEPELRLRAPL